MAYIGETDAIAPRLLNHLYGQKSFWSSALVFCRNE
jgi:hypothetical protein